MALIEYVSPLLPLARMVLDRLESILSSFHLPVFIPASIDQRDLLKLCGWTAGITEHLHRELNEEQLEDDDDGKRKAAYADIFSSSCPRLYLAYLGFPGSSVGSVAFMDVTTLARLNKTKSVLTKAKIRTAEHCCLSSSG